MGLNRSLRRWVVGAMMAVLLFAQIATAAYACPAQGQAGGGSPQSMAGMPCAEMMAGAQPVDDAQPGLCHEHCQADTAQPPADPAQFTHVPAAAMAGYFIVSMPLAKADAEGRWSAQERRLDRAPPDDHRVVHCCWRI